jgi:hypothetical protein
MLGSLLSAEQMEKIVKEAFLAKWPRYIEGRRRELQEAIDDKEDESFIEYLRGNVIEAEKRYQDYTE